MDLRPPLDPIWLAFSLPATVIVPGGAPVVTSGVWVTPQTFELPSGSEARTADARRTLALRRDEVAVIPRDSRVLIAEIADGSVREWRVDGFGRVEAQIIEVLLVPGAWVS